MGGLATVGLIDTASITLERWGVIGQLACPGGADGCDKVLSSVWGTVLGQPLALYGLLAYGAVMLLSLLPLIPGVQQWLLDRQSSSSTLGARRSGRTPDLFWQLGYLLSLAMAVFSLVLVGLMLFRIEAICAFCLLSAGISLALLVLHWFGRDWEDRGQLLFRSMIVAVLVALIGLGGRRRSPGCHPGEGGTAPGDHPEQSGQAGPGRAPQQHWCSHVQRLLVPPLP